MSDYAKTMAEWNGELQARIVELEAELAARDGAAELIGQEMRNRRERAEKAEAALAERERWLQQVQGCGHNDGCIFCALKDTAALGGRDGLRARAEEGSGDE